MSYISLTKKESLARKKKTEGLEEEELKSIGTALKHPIRIRIMNVMVKGDAMTQRNLGKALCLSNAAVHYHLKRLIAIEMIYLDSTRNGVHGITEKLYKADIKRWLKFLDAPSGEIEFDFYLDYAISWMHERHREGVEVLKQAGSVMPLLSGSYVVNAPHKDVLAFKRKIEKLHSAFFEKHQKGEGDDLLPVAVTFAMLPSRDQEEAEESRNIIEFEPAE